MNSKQNTMKYYVTLLLTVLSMTSVAQKTGVKTYENGLIITWDENLNTPTDTSTVREVLEVNKNYPKDEEFKRNQEVMQLIKKSGSHHPIKE